MIDQPHSLDLRKPAPVTTGDEGNAKRMKGRVNSRTFEQVVDATILIGGKNAGHIGLSILQACERGFQRRVNRNTKILAGIALLTLGISQPNCSAIQVDVFHWDRTLRKPTAGVERNFKASPHPFRFYREFPPDPGNFGVRQFGLFFLRLPRDTQPSDWISFRELASDRLINELGEKLDLKQGCVVPDFFSVERGCLSPTDVCLTVSVSDLPGVNDTLFFQERFNGLPSDRVTLPGLPFALPVGCDIAGNPCLKCRGTDRTSNPLLFGAGFISQSLSFAGVCCIIGAEAGGLFHPQTGVQIASAEIPERRASFFLDVRHEPRVGQGRTNVKENKGDYLRIDPDGKWVCKACGFLPLHNEALLFPAKNRPVGQESDISACFLNSENSQGAGYYNNLPAFALTAAIRDSANSQEGLCCSHGSGTRESATKRPNPIGLDESPASDGQSLGGQNSLEAA